MYYHLFFYLIWKVVKKHKTFFWESGVWYNLSGSVYVMLRPFLNLILKQFYKAFQISQR